MDHASDRSPARTSRDRPQLDAHLTKPTLVLVTGHSGSGKTTLAHEISRAIPCPAICRDELKEGLMHARPGHVPTPGDQAQWDTYNAFFGVIEVLVRVGVTHVAEAAFQHKLWAQRVTPLLGEATVKIVRCTVVEAIARERIERRMSEEWDKRKAHTDKEWLAALESGTPIFEDFDPLTLDVPTIEVDTSDGYQPALEEIVEFVG